MYMFNSNMPKQNIVFCIDIEELKEGIESDIYNFGTKDSSNSIEVDGNGYNSVLEEPNELVKIALSEECSIHGLVIEKVMCDNDAKTGSGSNGNVAMDLQSFFNISSTSKFF